MDYLLFALLAAFWGGSFVAIKYVVGELPPVFGALLRVALALAALTAVFKASGRSLRVPPETRRRMWLAGLFTQGLPFALLFWGETRVSPGLAGILNGTVPLWTYLLGAAAGSEPFSRRKLPGLLLSFLGVAVVCRPMIGFGGTRGEILGACAVLLMAISYGLGTLLSRSLLSGRVPVDFRANLFHQHCASLVFLAAAASALGQWADPRLLLASPRLLVSALYLGLASTALAWIIYYHLIREWGAVRASAVTYLIPIFALLWDFLFFRNAPGPSEIFGASAILAGVVLLQLGGAAPRPARA